nr:MAG TPA: hypothetical protein [Caudoviricetes sp.]
MYIVYLVRRFTLAPPASPVLPRGLTHAPPASPALRGLVLYILSPLYVRISPNCTTSVTK